MSQLLTELLVITKLQESEGADPATLTNSKEFKEFEKTDPAFTKLLLMAWNGDAKEYVAKHGKSTDLLFPLNFKKDYIERKFPKISQMSNFKALESGLIKIYNSAFPHVPGSVKIDTSVWQHEKWARESTEFDQAEYNMLKEELLTEDYAQDKLAANKAADVAWALGDEAKSNTNNKAKHHDAAVAHREAAELFDKLSNDHTPEGKFFKKTAKDHRDEAENHDSVISH